MKPGKLNYSTTPTRVAFSLVAGAALGAAVTTIDYLTSQYKINGHEYFLKWGFSNGLTVLSVSFLVWLFCIVIFGGPLWSFLHLKGFRSWRFAAIFGGIIPFIVVFCTQTGFLTGRAAGNLSYYGSGGQQWLDGKLTPFGWKIAIIDAGSFALIGMFVAILIWRTAYRRR